MISSVASGLRDKSIKDMITEFKNNLKRMKNKFLIIMLSIENLKMI